MRRRSFSLQSTSLRTAGSWKTLPSPVSKERKQEDSTMESLLGFKLDSWDYATFGAFAIIGLGFMGLLVLVCGAPGRIAAARRHPEAEAVNLMGWLGFLAIIPWVNALIWAFKPSEIVDVRHLPAEVERDTDEALARMAGHPAIERKSDA
jgi:hypothetical protein